MFDRIAGFYDLMNSAMTAGLHHRWRARAADLAAVAPGDRVLDVATGTGDLALELASRVGPTRLGGRLGLRREDARPGARQGGAQSGRHGSTSSWGNALELPYGDGEFAAATVGFGARNFSDLDGGSLRDGAGREARREGGGPRDHDAAQATAVDVLRRSGSTGSFRSSGGSPATAPPTSICLRACKPLPRAGGARGVDAARRT